MPQDRVGKMTKMNESLGYSFCKITPSDDDWRQIESSSDSTVFHCKAWMAYIKKIGYHPYVLAVFRGKEKIGFFVGEKLWRVISIVAAPFEGLGTYTQGLVLFQTIAKEERVAIYKDLFSWLKAHRIASYFQVDDWELRDDSIEWDDALLERNQLLAELRIKHDVRPTLYVDLRRTQEELWKGLHYKSCKYCINKAKKLGLHLEIVDRGEDIEGFVNVHHAQVMDVCRRKKAKPKTMQGKDRMMALCKSLFPDRVLMVKVVGADDAGILQVMSTGIFCLDKGQSTYWTGASYEKYMKYCPNELMVWEAMRILHERGAGDLNFCGMARYKLKFGTIYAYVPRLVFTEYPWLDDAKKRMKRVIQKLGIKR